MPTANPGSTPPSAPELLAQLQACETADPVLSRVADRIREVVPTLAVARGLDDLRLFVTDFTRAGEPLRSSSYYTDGVKALFRPPVIVVDAAFMLDLEAAFRSFDLSESLLESQYLRSDEDLFGLVKRIRADPQGYLARLRRLTVPKLKRDGSYVVETLTLVLLFFVSHELGHLLADRDERSYTTFLRPDAELEGRIANAVLKLCRHADEFAKYKFGLPGFTAVVQPESEVRGEVRKLAEGVDDALEVNHAKYFGDEIAADEVAAAILSAHLQEIGRKDAVVGDQYRYLLCEGLFGAALYRWYRDLLTFGEKLGLGQGANSRALMVEMMKERGSYIKAASLFGDVHRFTLLRAALAMEAILRAGSDFFDRPAEQRTIWWTKPSPAAGGGASARWWQKIRFVWKPASAVDAALLKEFWQAESLQRYYLLCITMDTAVKIAYVCCATGWMLEADRRRQTAQLFMMNFEPINAAVDRLRRFA